MKDKEVIDSADTILVFTSLKYTVSIFLLNKT